MKNITRTAFLLVLIATFIAPSLSYIEVVKAQTTPTLEITIPTSLPPYTGTSVYQGGIIIVNATGFPVNTTLYVYANNTILLAVLYTNESGSVYGPVLLPFNMPPGTYIVGAKAYNRTNGILEYAVSSTPLKVLLLPQAVSQLYEFKAVLASYADSVMDKPIVYITFEKKGVGLMDPSGGISCDIYNETSLINTIIPTKITDGLYNLTLSPSTYGPGTYMVLCKATHYVFGQVINFTDTVTVEISPLYDNIHRDINMSSSYILTNITLSKNELENLLNNINASLIAELGDVNASLSQLILTSKGDILLQITDSRNTIEQLINLTRDNLSLVIENSKGEILGKLDAVNTSLSDLDVALAASLNDNITLAITNAKGDVIAELGDVNASLSQLILTSKGDILLQITDSRNTILVKLDNVQSHLDGSISNAKGDIIYEIGTAKSYLDGRISSSTADIKNAINRVGNSTVAIISASISSSTNTLSSRINNVSSKMDVLSGNIIAVINAKYESLLNGQEDVKSKLDSDYSNIINELIAIEGLSGKVNKSLANLLYSISQDQANGFIEVNKKLDSLNITLYTKAGELEGMINDKSAELAGLIETKAGDIIAVIKTNSSIILAKLDESSKSIVNTINNAKSDLSGKIDQSNSDLKKEISDSRDAVSRVSQLYGGSATAISVVTLLAVSGLAIFMRRK